ncbi:MAG TPA: hypothetical protein VD738_06095 [Nitrospira sp.]|jgi:hypothetical protein|nr:hypothetical protein [Nitrospira sp.]
MGIDSLMNVAPAIQRISGLVLLLGVVSGCADEFVIFHSRSGDPLLIARRAYTADACIERVKEDAARMGVTFRQIHVRGSFVGRSLLWPIEKGYACEAAIGPEQYPAGAYPIDSRIIRQAS